MKIVRRHYADEFGLFSAAVSWAPHNMFLMHALKHYNYDVAYVRSFNVKSYGLNEIEHIPQEAVVIDLNQAYWAYFPNAYGPKK